MDNKDILANIRFDPAYDGEDRSVLTPRFVAYVDRLINGDEQPTVRELTTLSDLSAPERTELAARWGQIPVERRRRILSSLVQLAEDNIEYDFNSVYLQAIEDSDARVRKSAAEGLWESESSAALNRLLERFATDDAPEVRAAAAISLGHFVYQAEMGKLRPEQQQRLRDTLLAGYNDSSQPSEVRRRAVEAVAYLSDDAAVMDAIQTAYCGNEAKMQASAVHAMGRNMDARWLNTVLSEMNSASAEMCYEAARAAGELTDARATPRLIELLGDNDTEVRLVAIWALGQVGGKAATNALQRLTQSDDLAMSDAAQEALAEARLNDNPLGIF